MATFPFSNVADIAINDGCNKMKFRKMQAIILSLIGHTTAMQSIFGSKIIVKQ
jgi:hypothetical protein